MNKILLVYEDYADLMSVEATLKKVGFDVIGLSSEYSVAEQVLSFNPDVVVGAGRGGKVSSLGVGKRLKEMARWHGKSVLIFPPNIKPTPQELIKIRVDMILESPVTPLRILQVLAKLLGHEESVLLERLNKPGIVEGGPRSATLAAVGGKFLTEAEAILVRGNTPGGSAANTNPDAEEKSSEADVLRIPEKGFELTKEDIDSEKQPNMEFRFGERMKVVDENVVEDSSETLAFPDVDMKSLEKEILGGGAPEVERIEIATLPEEPAVSSSEQEVARAELQKAESGLAEKMKKYAAMVSDVKVSPQSTVTRVEARRRQRAIAADWDRENINELDRLRREFTKALFKK